MNLLPQQRHLFDIPEDITYFNCAYNAPQLNASKERLHEGVVSKCHPWKRTPQSFFRDAEKIRQLAADILDGSRDGFAIVPAASYGISSAARAIEPHLHSGDKILVIAEEFPSNVLPWRRTAQETGATLLTVPCPDDGDWTPSILNHIDSAVKVVAVSTCHWTNGAYIDLGPISRACRNNGAYLVVDGTQTLGAMPFSVKSIKPDFLVAAGYKWLLGPYGFSLMYVSERCRDSRPLEETWLARENAENFESLVNYSDAYMPGARRFDVGEKCTATILPGVVAALEQIEQWQVKRISDTLGKINATIAARLSRLDFFVPADSLRCPHMFGVLLPQHYTGDLVSELSRRSIYISQRGNALRISPHLHITETDVVRLLDTIEELVQ